MKKLSIIVFALLMGVIQYSKTLAQSPGERGFDIDIDPIAFALNGFSFHGGYVTGAYRFDLGIFGIDIPEWVHGKRRFRFLVCGFRLES